jgi:N-acetyl-anhydromuramyl-L-alanine amidase AmpD
LRAIPRSQWTSRPPVLARILPMNGVQKITVHHEGSGVVEFDDAATTAKQLEMVREFHAVDRGWGDIGYHYVIDRAGRVWQGRDTAYQGAHVRDHNAHNLGVMVLGNFDLQRPTEAQVTTLRASLITLQRSYRVPTAYVYTHQELNPTECPGVALQQRMVALRRSGLA